MLSRYNQRYSNKNEIRLFWINLANHHDSCMQSYRIIFITSETILISFAALIITDPISLINFLLISSLFLIGIIIISNWEILTWNRGIWVFYCNTQALKIDKGDMIKTEKERPYLTFLNWKEKKNWNPNKKLLEIDCIRMEYGLEPISKEYTRNFLGIILPWIYRCLWLIIIFIYSAPHILKLICLIL